MRMRLLGVLAAMLLPLITKANVLGDLSAAEKDQLDSGQMVVQSENVRGGIWPKLIVYTTINAPPDVVEDLMMDYDSAPKYNTSLVSAKVVASPSANVKNVRYTEKMPLFGTVSYTVQNTYKQSPKGMTISWTLLDSPLASESTGSLTIEPYGDISILRYANYVKPKSDIAVLARGAALSSVKNLVAAIKKEAERRASAANRT